MWAWLYTNSVQLQTIAYLLGISLSAATIVVLVVTFRAAIRQARAAEAQATAAETLTKVAEEQTKAALDAAISARRQSELIALQIEQGTAPLLVAEPDDRSGFKNYKLTNRGQGTAFKIMYWHGGLEAQNGGNPIESYSVQPSTLGPGVFSYLNVPPAWEVITVRYAGLDRESRWTVVYRDPRKAQEHIVKKGLTEYYL